MMKIKEIYDNIASQGRRCLTHIIKELWTLQRVDMGGNNSEGLSMSIDRGENNG